MCAGCPHCCLLRRITEHKQASLPAVEVAWVPSWVGSRARVTRLEREAISLSRRLVEQTRTSGPNLLPHYVSDRVVCYVRELSNASLEASSASVAKHHAAARLDCSPRPGLSASYRPREYVNRIRRFTSTRNTLTSDKRPPAAWSVVCTFRNSPLVYHSVASVLHLRLESVSITTYTPMSR